MQEKSENKPVNPIGLYRDPESGREIGAIHEIQADAMVQQGYKLVKEGREAAMTVDSELHGNSAAAEKPKASKKTKENEEEPEVSDSPAEDKK